MTEFAAMIAFAAFGWGLYMQLKVRKLPETAVYFKTFADHSPQTISIKDAQGRYRFVNRAYLSHYQLSIAQIIGKHPGEVFPSHLANEDYERELRESHAVIENELSVIIDGREFTEAITRFPILDQWGELIATGSVGTNISEKKRREKALIDKSEEVIGRLPSEIFPNEPFAHHSVELDRRVRENRELYQQEETTTYLGRQNTELNVRFPIIDEHGRSTWYRLYRYRSHRPGAGSATTSTADRTTPSDSKASSRWQPCRWHRSRLQQSTDDHQR